MGKIFPGLKENLPSRKVSLVMETILQDLGLVCDVPAVLLFIVGLPKVSSSSVPRVTRPRTLPLWLVFLQG